MRRLDDVQARIEARVPALTGRIERAGAFSALIERGAMPQVTPAGYVLPGGLAGGAIASASSLFIQGVRETVLVVLAVRVAGDATGGAAVDEATPLVGAVIEAVAGWGPDDAPGVFALGQAELVGSQAGLMLFQIDFSLEDQLRIVP